MRWHYYSICCVLYREKLKSSSWKGAPSVVSHVPKLTEAGPQPPKWLGKPDWPSPENTLFTLLSWASKQRVSGTVLKRHEKPLLKLRLLKLYKGVDKLNEQGKEAGARKHHSAAECPFPNTPCTKSGEKGTRRWLWQKRGEFKKESRKKESTSHQIF